MTEIEFNYKLRVKDRVIERLKEERSKYKTQLLKNKLYIKALIEQQELLFKDYIKQINRLYENAPLLFYNWFVKRIGKKFGMEVIDYAIK
jgi:hypothetical protein